MKKSILSACILIFLFACKKNDPNTSSDTGTLITSISSTNFSYHLLEVDSFSYADNGHIARIIQWQYDITQNPVLVDSIVWTFTFTGSANVPSSYTTDFYNAGDNSVNYKDNCTPSYDNQGRVIFDTSLMVTTSGNVQRESYFKYTAAYTVINQAAAYTDKTDTIFMDNGNIAKFSAYTDSTGPGNFDFGYAYTYTGTPNPLYDSTISASIGPLLLVRTTNLDFISKYLPATAKNIVFAPDLGFTYTTNPSGLPTKCLVKDRTSGELFSSMTYHYQ